MADSLYPTDKKLLFRETFENEQSVRRNGGVPLAGVTFQKGTVICNNTGITFKLPTNGVYSVRLKLSAITPTTQLYFLDNRKLNGTGYVWIDANKFTASSGTAYLNGINTDAISSSSKDLIISGITLKGSILNIGCNLGDGAGVPCTIELFEIYSGTLTAEEVKNLYENKRYREVGTHGEQLGSEVINQSTWYTLAYWNAVPTGANWSQVGSTLVSNDTGQPSPLLRRSNVWTLNKKYKITISITRTSGQVTVYDGGVNFTYLSATGTYNIYFIPNTDTRVEIYSDLFIGSITAFSIKEVLVNSTKLILDVCACDGVVRNRLSGNTYGDNFKKAAVTNYSSASAVITKLTDPTHGEYFNCYDLIDGDCRMVLSTGNLNTNKVYRTVIYAKSSDGSELRYYNPSTSVYELLSASLSTTWKMISFDTLPYALDILIRIPNSAHLDIIVLSVKEVIPSVVNTNVSVVKDGDVSSMRFNYTGNIDCGNYDTLVGDKSFAAWITYSTLSVNWSGIINNGKFLVIKNNSNIAVYRDGVTAGTATIPFFQNKYFFLCVTSSSIGLSKIYVNGVLIDTKSSGTPVAGNTNIFIGSGGISHGGKMNSVRVYDGLLTPAEIAQMYSNEKSKFGL